MRYDAFIIWGNGIHHINEIINIIRNDNNFDIIRIISKNINNMKKFTFGIYKCDTVPWKHIKTKTKYLIKSPKKIVFILVKNINPNEKMYGEGKFRHIQCEKINTIKNIIRSKYNPKFLDSNKKIDPLPKGVSHEHCIHATDYETQVDYLLKFLKLKNLAYYNRNNKFEYYIPWHLDVKDKYVKKNIKIDELRTYDYDSIIDTPHYQYVLGNKKQYIDYFNKNFGTVLQEDHFPKAFDKLINNFSFNYQRYDGKKTAIIITRPKISSLWFFKKIFNNNNNDNIILDGLHRAVILKKMGFKKIKCIQI